MPFPFIAAAIALGAASGAVKSGISGSQKKRADEAAQKESTKQFEQRQEELAQETLASKESLKKQKELGRGRLALDQSRLEQQGIKSEQDIAQAAGDIKRSQSDLLSGVSQQSFAREKEDIANKQRLVGLA